MQHKMQGSCEEARCPGGASCICSVSWDDVKRADVCSLDCRHVWLLVKATKIYIRALHSRSEGFLSVRPFWLNWVTLQLAYMSNVSSWNDEASNWVLCIAALVYIAPGTFRICRQQNFVAIVSLIYTFLLFFFLCLLNLQIIPTHESFLWQCN